MQFNSLVALALLSSSVLALPLDARSPMTPEELECSIVEIAPIGKCAHLYKPKEKDTKATRDTPSAGPARVIPHTRPEPVGSTSDPETAKTAFRPAFRPAVAERDPVSPSRPEAVKGPKKPVAEQPEVNHKVEARENALERFLKNPGQMVQDFKDEDKPENA